MQNNFTIHLYCPWCKKGEIIADNRVKIKVSAKCHICNNTYIADLYDMETYRKIEDIKRGRVRPFSIRLPCPNQSCKGEIRADGCARVRLSVCCTKKKNCKQVYIADLWEMCTYPTKAIRKGKNE